VIPAARLLVGLALAGTAGTLARFGAIALSVRLLGAGFPWGVLAVNAFGCFLYGIFATQTRLPLGAEGQLVVLTGFMGAFTTFSTYAFDLAKLLERGAYAQLAAYAGLSNVCGLALVIAGAALGKRLA
jgi:CrcB protein